MILLYLFVITYVCCLLSDPYSLTPFVRMDQIARSVLRTDSLVFVAVALTSYEVAPTLASFDTAVTFGA